MIDSIAGEIQRSLDFFMATSGEGEIARIYRHRRHRRACPAAPGDRAASAGAGRGLDAHRTHRGRVARGRRQALASASGRTVLRRARARRCGRNGRRARDKHQPTAAEARAPNAARKRASVWLARRADVVLGRSRGAVRVPRLKNEELQEQLRINAELAGADRRHQEAVAEPRRGQAKLEQLRCERGRDLRSCRAREPGRPRCCSSSRGS